MNSGREEIKRELIEKFTKKVEQVLYAPTVTMTDIENVVAEMQRGMGQEVAEGLLRLKKTSGKAR